MRSSWFLFRTGFHSASGRSAFRTPSPKMFEGRWAVECGAGCALELIHAERSSNVSSRVHLDRRQRCRLDHGEPAARLVLAELAHDSLPMAPAEGALRRASAGGDSGGASASVFGHGCWRDHGYRLSSTLPVEVSGHCFHESLVTGCFFNACLDTCSMSAPGCFWTCCPFFYAKVHSGPEVDSGLALRRVNFKIAEWRRAHR